MIKIFPEEIRASWISRSYWCHEASRIKATIPDERIRIRTPRKIELEGLNIHEVLRRRKFPKAVEEFDRRLAAVLPLYGIFEGTRIYCHPDEHRVRKRIVQIVENKSTKGKPSIYQTCTSTFQTKTYAFIEDQIIPALGYTVASVHRVMYWRRPTVRIKKLILLKVVPVYFYPEEYKKDLHYIFEVWRKKEDPLPPAKWKCKQCELFNKVRCRFYTGEVKLSRQDWKERFAR